jgi:hypothetical protein
METLLRTNFLGKIRPPLTVAEIVRHPEFKNAIWNLPATRHGRASVAQGRGGPLEIAYEIHGQGQVKLVVCIMCFFALGVHQLQIL